MELYNPRNPLQASLASQASVLALTTNQLPVEIFLQEWVRDACQAFREGRKREGMTTASRILKLCAEEIARAYNQHLLAKLHDFLERAREQAGRRVLPKLATLEQAQKDAAAEVSQIVMAQTIWEIYTEAWNAYTVLLSQDDVDGPRMPDELPRWMTTRKYLPPNDGWSAFVFAHLFGRTKPPKWDGSRFLRVYRSFKSKWEAIAKSAGQFDHRLKRIIGACIMVTFNSDQWKEVGTSHGRETWYHGKPAFFQIQYCALYFSPPQYSHDIRLDAATEAQPLPGDLMPDAATRVLTADRFQYLERVVHQDWLRVFQSGQKSVQVEERNRNYRRALRHMILLSGPNWVSDGKIDWVIPWRFGKDDFLRLPVPPAKSLRERR